MVFLGVILSHNASACLMIDGKVTIVAQEERFTKIKNFLGYPKKSIDYILKFLGHEDSEFKSSFPEKKSRKSNWSQHALAENLTNLFSSGNHY